MTIEALGYISDCLESLNIPYEFLEWTNDLSFPYFIGEYTEMTPFFESGLEEGTFMITGTTNQSKMTLEVYKEMIKEFFPPTGRSEILSSGSGIVVSYDTAFPVPTGEQGLHRLQINLNIKEWKVN